MLQRRCRMSVPLILTFVSTMAFAIQFLIFAYLYSSHRVRFFRYLLWAWGAYTLSKGLHLVNALVPALAYPMTFCIAVASVSAAGFTLAAALAHRWNYLLHRRDLAVGVAIAVILPVTSGIWDGDQRLAAVALGAVQVAAGVLF